MKLRIVFVAASLALGAGAAQAATKTDCNPFANPGAGFKSCSVGFGGGFNGGAGAGGLSVALSNASEAAGGLQRRVTRSVIAGTPAASSMSLGTGGTGSGLGFVGSDEDDVALIDGESDAVSAVVPLPASGLLLLAGLGGLAMTRRRKG